MFDPKKFDFEHLDFHVKEFARNLVFTTVDSFREPTEFMFGDHIVDHDSYFDGCLEEEERIWDAEFSLPVRESMILLDCVQNEVYNGCFYGRAFPKFETLEVLFDSRVLGEKITLNALRRGKNYDDGTVMIPEIEFGEYDALVERVAKRIRSDCDNKLGWYYTWIEGGGPA